MSCFFNLRFHGFGVLWLTLVVCEGRAQTIVDVDLNFGPGAASFYTTPLALDFTLSDGNQTGDANNTVILRAFVFGAGSANNPAWYTTSTNLPGSAASAGTGITGDMLTSVSMTDNDPAFNDFTEGITPGSTLSFRMAMTTSTDDSGTPDNLSLRILQAYDGTSNIGIPVMTSSGGSQGDNTLFLTANLGAGLSVQAFDSLDTGVGAVPYIIVSPGGGSTGTEFNNAEFSGMLCAWP